MTVVWEPYFKIWVDSLGSSIGNHYSSGPKVKQLGFLIDYYVSVGRDVDLNRELSFLNFRANHAVLH